MRKVLFATTALATVAGAVAVANAEVSISGSVEWRYMSVSDDDTAQASDSDFQATNDITISMSSTTDNGLTISQYINIGNGAVGTSESSISGDFGTIAFNQDSGGAHAASSFDVTSGGVAGGHGDPAFTLYDGSGTAVTKVEIDEAQIDDSEDGALNYFSPTFAGFQFGFGTSHLDHADDNTSTSMGAKYSGSMGDVSYSVGYASYDGTNSNIEGTHTGVNVSFSGLSLGAGSSTNKDGNALEKETISYSAKYAVSDVLTVAVGQSNSENDNGGTKLEAANTTISAAYTIAPGLVLNISSHDFEYKSGGSVANDGQAIQSELKMSF